MDFPVVAILVGFVLNLFAINFAADLLARMGFATPDRKSRIGNIDGLRGYLAIFVFVHHFVMWIGIARFGRDWGPLPSPFFNQLGAMSVGVFFMVTGLLFYPRIRAGFKGNVWTAVFVGRVFRIIPLVAASVIAITLIVMIRTGRTFDRDYPIAFLTWVAARGTPPLLGYPDSGRLNASVFWSLAYEWKFYLLIMPACAFAIDRLRTERAKELFPFIFLGATIILYFAPSLSFSERIARFLPLFGFGMAAYWFMRNESVRTKLVGPAVGAAAILATLVGMTLTPHPDALSMPLFAFAFIAIACGNSLFGALERKSSIILGECSFGIYVIHGIVLNVFFVDGDPFVRAIPTAWLPLLIPLLGMVVVFVAALAHVTIERPALNYGHALSKRIAKRLRPRPADGPKPIAKPAISVSET